MIVECFLSCFGHKVFRIGFFAKEGFLHANKLFLFQGFDMTCQVAVCNVQKFFQRIEFKHIVNGKRGHDAELDPAIKSLVQTSYRYFHRSYLK